MNVTLMLELYRRAAVDEHYANFGLYGDPTGVGAPGVPINAVPGGPGVDNRFQSPGMPRSFFGGARISF